MGPESKTEKWLFQHANYADADCLIWPYGRDGQGYARAKVAGFSTRLAHRIMCELVNGPPPFPSAVARHTCGKGHLGCVSPRHLKWGTVAQNNADKDAHGNKPVGEKIGLARLSHNKVLAIRSMQKDGLSQRSIASHFGVSPGTIQAIIEGRTWGHVA